VITVSEFSKHQIAHHLGISEAKISVIYAGPRNPSSPSTMDWDALQRRYNLKKPYVLAFGGSRPHKNISRLVAAFADFARTFPHSLVIVGDLPADGEVESNVLARDLGARVILTEYVPDDHVMPLLSAADIFAFPSWYEGFGLPVLDAQRAGVPVACSRAASLPEVAGEGAEYFDPFSVEQITMALRRCAERGEHRRHLVASAMANVERFSWDEAAHRTLVVYERTVAGNATHDGATYRSARMIPHPTT
jgi:glycosyltransferase involved in cell wall biosynthesis